MAPAAPSEMQYYDRRLASFDRQTPAESSKSRSKHLSSGWPHSTATHPYLTPKSLAEAGFFYTPKGDADDDLCTCFTCKKSLGGWEPEDDPFEEHLNRGGCAWAIAVCGIRLGQRKGKEKDSQPLRFDIPDSLPQSDKMIKSRVTTYGKSWPHKGKKAFLPSSVTKLAQAGFVYNPAEDNKDCVSCFLCGYSVGDWEATDDPWELHLRKSPNCIFFHAQLGDIIGIETRMAEADLEEQGNGAGPSKIEHSKRPARVTKAAKSKFNKATLPTIPTTSTSEAPSQSAPPTPPPNPEPIARKAAARQIRTRKASVAADVPSADERTSGDDGNELPTEEEIRMEVEGEETGVSQGSTRGKRGKGRPSRATITAARSVGRRAATVTSSAAQSDAEVEKSAYGPPTIAVDDLPALIQEVDLAANEPPSDTDQDIDAPIQPGTRTGSRARGRGRASKARVPATRSAKPKKGKVEIAQPIAAGSVSTSEAESTAQKEAEVVGHGPPTASVAASVAAIEAESSESELATDAEDGMNARTPRQQDHPIAEYVGQGAKEARAVFESLGTTAMRTTPIPLKTKNTIPRDDGAQNNPFLEKSDEVADVPLDFDLTDQQADMTVEEFLRYELQLRYNELKEKGERQIREWEERSAKAREVIAGL